MGISPVPLGDPGGVGRGGGSFGQEPLVLRLNILIC
jgi:hypothetical protein